MEAKFWYCTESFKKMWNKYGIYFSEQFCNYFADQIQKIIYREAGLKPSSKVGLSVFKPYNEQPMYEPGIVSKINTAISILPEFKDEISFCWQSKTGKIVHTHDEDFDESDLECWIEGLKPDIYFQQLNSVSIDHPLKIKNLPYTLTVKGFGMHMGLEIALSNIEPGEMIIHQLSEVVQKHNDASEAKGRAKGVVHHCEGTIADGKVNFRIDVGSAGVVFIRKLLKALAKYPEVKEVVVDL